MISICYDLFLISLIGYNLSFFLDLFNIYSGDKGINYYGEAHITSWNSLIHTIFMPFTTYGILLFFPNLLYLNQKSATLFMSYIYLFYFFHYISINLFIGILFGLFYREILNKSKKSYSRSLICFIKGITITITSLCIQEFIGHYLSYDIPSRVEGVINAILYANYFALQSFIKMNYIYCLCILFFIYILLNKLSSTLNC